MSTPLYDAVLHYVSDDYARFHMPGHKGRPLRGLGDVAAYDLTEVTGLDSLYLANGVIAETEAAYSTIYNTKASCISTGGSTLCIQAMLALACPPGAKLIMARGIHAAALHTAALLDLHPVWAYPKIDLSTGLACAVEPMVIDALLRDNPDAVTVYITSPDYFGTISDVRAISEICNNHDVLLLVDNAHGAHLRFMGSDLHPMSQGADACADSLHKTLPVLTGGAMLHIQNEALAPRAKACMALFGSTSPGYLTMLSIDAALPYLADTAAQDFARVAAKTGQLKQEAAHAGFAVPVPALSDPARLTLGFWTLGYTKEAFLEYLHTHRIEPEYVDTAYCVLMASGFNSEEDFSRLSEMIAEAVHMPAYPSPSPAICETKQVVPLRKALFALSETVDIDRAYGRVAGSMIAPCPPGIPLLVPGERITRDAVEILHNAGISTINVIKSA